MSQLKHRGPNDEGTFFHENVGLGHLRLSILDLSPAGHQPMFSPDRRYCIIYNGEVYNYLELRQELQGKYSFKTGTDTEVILAAYQEWGEACLHKFNGMFAFVIYDQVEQVVFGARDRFGIKPFYYFQDPEKFLFASEIKAILAVLPQRQPNEKAIFEFLIYNRTDQTEETFFEKIFKLKHGHFFTIANNQLKIRQWYNLREKLGENGLTADEFHEHLKASIKLRLRSDVPVGVCLSGGLDSSSIVAILLKEFGKSDLHTFSAVYGEQETADESRFIREFDQQLTNMHYTFPTGETLYNDLESFIRAQSEPVASIGPYAQFKVMELARENVVVTLDGQGADEQLAGYHYFFGSNMKELLRRQQYHRFVHEALAYLFKHQSLHAFKYLAYYSLPVSWKKKVGRQIYGSVSKDFFNRLNHTSQIDADLYHPNSLNESLLQHFEFKLEHLLKWEDHNGMWFSIEPRVPFLDHQLVEKTLAASPDKIICNATNKYILRAALKDILPEKIRQRRDKKGFSTPSDKWFRLKKFEDLIISTIHSPSFKQRGYFNVEASHQRYQRHLAGNLDCAKDIWKWLNLEIWFRIFIDYQ